MYNKHLNMQQNQSCPTHQKTIGLEVWDHPWSYRAHWPQPTGQLNPEGGISCPGEQLIPEGWASDRLVTRWQKCCAQVSISACHLAHCHAEGPEVRVLLQQHKAAVQGADLSKMAPVPSLSWSWPKFHFRPTVKILVTPDQSAEKSPTVNLVT